METTLRTACNVGFVGLKPHANPKGKGKYGDSDSVSQNDEQEQRQEQEQAQEQRQGQAQEQRQVQGQMRGSLHSLRSVEMTLLFSFGGVSPLRALRFGRDDGLEGSILRVQSQDTTELWVVS